MLEEADVVNFDNTKRNSRRSFQLSFNLKMKILNYLHDLSSKIQSGAPNESAI